MTDNRRFVRRSAGRRLVDKFRHLRDLWLFAVTVLVLLALSNGADTLTRVQEGRRVGTGVTCAVLSAISDAGRSVIVGSSKPPPAAQERAFERLGFPPFHVRRRQQQQLADKYVRSISDRVAQAVGARKASRLIQSDGTIDCRALARLTDITR